MVAFATGISGTLRKAAVFLVVLLGLVWTVSRTTSASSELEISGFILVQETDNGRWEIQARQASYMDEKEVLLNGVSARMVSGGQDRISVVSEKGRFESDLLILHLEGNVVIASSWGSSLQAPTVSWNGSADYLEASGGVKLQRGSIMVQGYSARYTIDTGTAWVLGKVRTILDTGKSGP
jgi:LPS export ABC transporter protein LptC